MTQIKINIIDANQDHDIDQDEIITSIIPDGTATQHQHPSVTSQVEKQAMKIKPHKERIHDKAFEL